MWMWDLVEGKVWEVEGKGVGGMGVMGVMSHGCMGVRG